jgi:hypothetical protein
VKKKVPKGHLRKEFDPSPPPPSLPRRDLNSLLVFPDGDLLDLRTLCQPPLDPSTGVSLVKRKVESSIPPGSTSSPYLMGCAIKGTWGSLGRQKEIKK